jgi:hypothetical protein
MDPSSKRTERRDISSSKLFDVAANTSPGLDAFASNGSNTGVVAILCALIVFKPPSHLRLLCGQRKCISVFRTYAFAQNSKEFHDFRISVRQRAHRIVDLRDAPIWIEKNAASAGDNEIEAINCRSISANVNSLMCKWFVMKLG